MPLSIKQAIRKYRVSAQLLPKKNRTSKLFELLMGGVYARLNFSMQPQEQTQWCWAATSSSVSIFYQPTSSWKQCTVASKIIGATCCNAPSPCNIPNYLDKALSITGNFETITQTLTFNQVEAEINSGKVIGTRVGWYGGGGHFMVIYGCKTINGVNYYNIDDPIYGKSEITENAYLSAYQGAGKWTHSYLTQNNVQI
ncbi:hypothetical protein QFZ20_002053 [Flavobacterium sp. W4I14]|nr:hypothetical protein [Flavobacterium sp. W4I14]